MRTHKEFIKAFTNDARLYMLLKNNSSVSLIAKHLQKEYGDVISELPTPGSAPPGFYPIPEGYVEGSYYSDLVQLLVQNMEGRK